MSEHTPTPWAVPVSEGNDTLICEDLGEKLGTIIADVSRPIKNFTLYRDISWDEAAANAAFIVKAVNNHDALVEALKMARNRIAVLGPFAATRHFDANEKVFLPKIDAVLDTVGSPGDSDG